jgi:hypothetical protein
VPFLPVVLVLAWQAVSRSASFALGWATSLYFGQVPGRQGRILSVISLLSAAWVVVLVGFALPITAGWTLETLGVIDRNFTVGPTVALGLAAAIVLAPPVVAAAAVIGEFDGERSIGGWLSRLPVSYPATLMLGVAVLMMVAITPVLLVQRWRRKRQFLQVPLVMSEGTDDDDLLEAVRTALHAIDVDDVEVRQAHGIKTWPMRAVAFAARHLLGAVVRGQPMELTADGMELYAYATNVSIVGEAEDAYRARAAVARELALTGAHLTWSDDAQALERRLDEANRAANGDVAELRRRLDELQAEIDRSSLNTEEWNVLYRERLQIEQRAVRREA